MEDSIRPTSRSPPPGAAPDLRLRTFFTRWFRALVDLDAPVWRALRKLVISPGRLAAAQLEPDGSGQDWARIHPVRLYLAVNVIFFLLAPTVNSSQISVWRVEHRGTLELQPALEAPLDRAIEKSGLEDGVYRLFLDRTMKAQQGAWVFILIPFLGLASFAVARRRRRHLVEHLVFATNLMSCGLILVLGIGISGRLVLLGQSVHRAALLIAVAIILFWMLGVAVLVFQSVRAFFELDLVRSLLLTGWLGTAFVLGLIIYLQVVFLVSLWSLRGLSAPTPG